MEIYRSWREWPGVPAGWKPADPPGARDIVRVKNSLVLRLLRKALPGRWRKVFLKGRDGSEIHYFVHESGDVALLKYKYG